MRRLIWLAAIGALALVMAALTPYVLRTEPTGQVVAWLVMLTGIFLALAAFIRAERLLRRLEREAQSDVLEN